MAEVLEVVCPECERELIAVDDPAVPAKCSHCGRFYFNRLLTGIYQMGLQAGRSDKCQQVKKDLEIENQS